MVFGHSSHGNGGLVYLRLTVKAPFGKFLPENHESQLLHLPSQNPDDQTLPLTKILI